MTQYFWLFNNMNTLLVIIGRQDAFAQIHKNFTHPQPYHRPQLMATVLFKML